MSSRRQTNVDKAVSLLRSKNIQVTGTTCNVGNAADREKLINMVSRYAFDSIEDFVFLEDVIYIADSGAMWRCGHTGVQCSREPVFWEHIRLHRGRLG